MKHVLPILAFLVSLSGHADQDQTFEAASELARTNVRGAFDGISGASAEGVVPKYGVVPPEAQYFQGGRGNTQDHGVAKIQSCANYSPGQDKIANQECEVVNFLARNPDIRPQFDLGNKDPMISNNRDKRERAQDVFETLGVNNATSDCTTSTETNPAKYATESCVSIHGVETHQCLLGREIDIDADANFECDKTISAFTSETRALSVTTQSCTYGREIYIDEDSNFQCDQTDRSYDELKCNKILSVDVDSLVSTCAANGGSILTVQMRPVMYGIHDFVISCGERDASGNPTFNVRYYSPSWSYPGTGNNDCDSTVHNVPVGVVTPIYPIPGANYAALVYPNPAVWGYYGGNIKRTDCRRWSGGAGTYLNPIVEFRCTGSSCMFYALIPVQTINGGDTRLVAMPRSNAFAGGGPNHAVAGFEMPISNENTVTYSWTNQCADLEVRSK